MKQFAAVAAAAVLALSVWGCGGGSTPVAESEAPPAPEPEAREIVVQLEPKNGSEVTGTATFRAEDGGVVLDIEVANAPPGEHAFHLHQIGDCSAPDGSSAGGHWNPEHQDHGKWGSAPFHLGDVGNISIDETGSGSFHMVSELWTMGTGEPNDIVGKSVILHAGADDFTSQPTGAAGGRIACGVIGDTTEESS
jgi:Cu-Zn family superoxide dismutase